jgi:hypothetical protein
MYYCEHTSHKKNEENELETLNESPRLICFELVNILILWQPVDTEDADEGAHLSSDVDHRHAGADKMVRDKLFDEARLCHLHYSGAHLHS